MMIKELSLRERLLLHCTANNTGCWIWQRNCYPTGYGQITYEGKGFLAHRLAMHAFMGFDLNSEAMILHRCDVKNCINPDHLYIGDAFKNARDAVERGQQLRGAKHPNAKLNEAKVKQIIQLLSERKSCVDIGRHFSVDPTLISLIKRRKIWRHVKE